MTHLNDLVENWTAWLLHAGWQAAMVVAVTAVLLLLARRTSAQFRYALLVIALVKFAAPPFQTLPIGLFSQPPSPVGTEFTVEVAAPSEVSHSNADSIGSPRDRESAQVDPRAAMSPRTNTADNATPLAEKEVGIAGVHWGLVGLVLLHLTGVIVVGLLFRRQYLQIRTLIRNSTVAAADITQLARTTARTLGIKSVPAIMISDQSDAPFATGLLKPLILLPRSTLDLPDDQLRIILGHELVHIRRRDLLIGWFETVLSILWWFHPGMWWLKRQLRRTREDCCDDVLLATRLAVRERYCETLIEAAARQTFQTPEPIALGFSNGEHPAARRIRRLMDSSLFRTRRLTKTALLLAVVIALLVLPGIRSSRAPVTETSLEGMFGWRNLPFDPDPDELAIVKECHQVVNRYRSIYTQNGRQFTRFDDPETWENLEAILQRKPDSFYAQHLLGTWYRRNGDPAKGQELLSAALKNAPIVLTQRYRKGNGEPLTNVTIDTMAIECNRVKNGSLDPSLHLEFVDLVTDSHGEIAVPVYDTVYRLYSRSYPDGYDTEMPRLGWFSSKSRIGVLPEITAWKKYSRPDFTRTAAESAQLADAKGSTTGAIPSGSNHFRIGRIARCQADGHFTERTMSNPSELRTLPRVTNAGYMDHAIIDLASPTPDRFEIGRVTVLDSKTKIPLSSFQPAAGVKIVDQTRFHLYSVSEKLPDEVDLVLTVHNYEAGAFRMLIPLAAKGTYTKVGVTFVNEYLGAGQHDGWSSTDGFYRDAKKLDFVSEMLFNIDAPQGRHFSLWLVTKDGQRMALETHSPLVRIPRPLAEIDHFELAPAVPAETIFFEKIALPPRTDPISQALPTAEFRPAGSPETLSTELFSPVVLRCRTQQGDAYSGVSAGEFGYGFDEQEPDQRDPESKSTAIIEAFAPPGFKLAPEFLSRSGTELQTAGGGGASAQWGTVLMRRLSVPLKELHSVKVRLVVESPDK